MSPLPVQRHEIQAGGFLFHFRAFEHFIDLGFVFQHCLSAMFQLASLNLIFTSVFKVTAEKSGFEGSEHAISSRQKILLK